MGISILERAGCTKGADPRLGVRLASGVGRTSRRDRLRSPPPAYELDEPLEDPPAVGA
jgi:hypothetical protein